MLGITRLQEIPYADLHDATFEDIAAGALPGPVADHFDSLPSRQLDTTETLVDFNAGRLSVDGLTTYYLHSMKQHADGLHEELVHMVDTTTGDLSIGHGYVRMMHNPVLSELRDLPFVGWTYTEPEARGQQLGLRRLFLMNAVTRTVLGGTLHAGQSPAPAAEQHWRALKHAGYAGRRSVGLHDRYRFRR